MTYHQQQSTVIYVHSTAHWEALQQQKAKLLGVQSPSPPPSSPPSSSPPSKTTYKSDEPKLKSRSNIGKEGSRRRQRWTNNNFSEHPQAVLYAEDLRPPGYEYKHTNKSNSMKAATILLEEQDKELPLDMMARPILPTILNRHIRHDLKKAHISEGLVTNYESQLITFIDHWLDNIEDLDKVCLEIQVVSNNQFERYVLHTLSQYYGLHSFSKTNDQNNRITHIFHPAYFDYVTKSQREDIDYDSIASWVMPEKSFFAYLFHK